MKKILLIVLTLSIFNVFAEAFDKKVYDMAGCGLGSMLFGKESPLFAMTLNGTGSQSIAITAGTSNCTPDAQSKKFAKREQLRHFIQTNKKVTFNDLSKGQGEVIETIAYLYQCEQYQMIGKVLKENFNTLNNTKVESLPEIIERILIKTGQCRILT